MEGADESTEQQRYPNLFCFGLKKLLGTWGIRMEGADESTELCLHPNLFFFGLKKLRECGMMHPIMITRQFSRAIVFQLMTLPICSSSNRIYVQIIFTSDGLSTGKDCFPLQMD